MKKVIFERTEFDSAEEFYSIIKRKLLLPNWFGNNPDALWDMLTGFIETPIEIEFVSFNKKENDYNGEVLSQILKCFKDAEKANPTEFKIKFKDE